MSRDIRFPRKPPSGRLKKDAIKIEFAVVDIQLMRAVTNVSTTPCQERRVAIIKLGLSLISYPRFFTVPYRIQLPANDRPV